MYYFLNGFCDFTMFFVNKEVSLLTHNCDYAFVTMTVTCGVLRGMF